MARSRLNTATKCIHLAILTFFISSTIHRIVRAIAVAPSSASASASNFWLNFFISVNNSITLNAIAFKFRTLLQSYVNYLSHIVFHLFCLYFFTLVFLRFKNSRALLSSESSCYYRSGSRTGLRIRRSGVLSPAGCF